MKYLEPARFLIEPREIPIIDVRSPSEYQKGHISGSINVPLFSDEERAIIGTLYAKKGQEAAIAEGLKMATPKKTALTSRARQITADGRLRVHCWRGGMRSEKMALLFEGTGFECSVLVGGYKAYRKKQREDFKEIKYFNLLEGPTGSGKTEILYAMQALGAQVLDLEALANHRGSAFGGIGNGRQPSTAQFHNDLHARLLELDGKRPIWAEGESLKIGNVTLPESLWNRMNNAAIFNLSVDESLRRERIKTEYGHYPTDNLLASLEKIKTRLGNLNHQTARDAIKAGDLDTAVKILLKYYDKSYQYSLKKNRNGKPLTIHLDQTGTANAAKLILKKAGAFLNE